MVVIQKKPSHSWWFNSHNSPRRSPWLHSTISELDEKTMAMLKLIEEDADSFAKRAEMYYRKRPELITMVEDFYRTHRSLAERFDLLKSESKTRLITPIGSPKSSKSESGKLTNTKKKGYDSYSDYTFESEESAGESEVDDLEELGDIKVEKDACESGESEVDDPEEQEEPQVEEEEEVSSKGIHENEILKLREEIERLKEENRIQKEQLMQKDDEKREVIRQLSSSMEILRENISKEKVNLRKRTTTTTVKQEETTKKKNGNASTVKQEETTKKKNGNASTVKQEETTKKKNGNAFEFNKFMGLFTGKLFTGSSRSKTSLVAL